MRTEIKEEPASGWRHRIHEIVFESETPAGRAFDVTVISLILLSVGAVILESVRSIRDVFGPELLLVEWTLTILFTFEYLLRLIAVRRPFRYIFSFYGLVDLLAIAGYYALLALLLNVSRTPLPEGCEPGMPHFPN